MVDEHELIPLDPEPCDDHESEALSVPAADEPAVSSRDRVVILGLGGGGVRIVAEIAKLSLTDDMLPVAADSKGEALADLVEVHTVQLGANWTRQEGAGGDVLLGERAAGASLTELRALIEPARFLVIVCGLGGGLGTGGAKIVARIAREAGVNTVFFGTLPFSFEGNWRRQVAADALGELRDLVDPVVVIPNDLLFSVLPADTPLDQAFLRIDSVLAEAIVGMAQLACPGALLPADTASLRTVLRRRNATSSIGVGAASGDGRWRQAFDQLLECPMLGGPEAIRAADVAIVTLTGDAKLSIGEVQACMDGLQQQLPSTARLIVGAYSRSDIEEFRIAALLCRYQDKPAQPPLPGAVRPQPVASTASRRRKSAAPSQGIQGELPLMEQALGIFAGATPTTVNGQNLDVPTFQRREILLDTGV